MSFYKHFIKKETCCPMARSNDIINHSVECDLSHFFYQVFAGHIKLNFTVISITILLHLWLFLRRCRDANINHLKVSIN